MATLSLREGVATTGFEDALPTLVRLGAAFWITSVISISLYAFYNAFLHPLRRYPGPLLYRAFRFPYVIAIHRGQFHSRLKELHDKYGPIVRIAPNELSYTDGVAWKDIYGNRPGHPPFPRNPTWFKKMSPDEPHSILGFDEEAHSRLRRAFSNSFSEKSLRDEAPVIESYLDTFMNQLKAPPFGREGKTVDLNKWFNFLTFDISGDLSFGESFNCLKTAKAHPWVEIAQDFGKGLVLIASVNQYPPIDRFLRYLLPKRVMQRNLDHREMSAAKARKRLAQNKDRPDFVTPAKKYSDQKVPISEKEWEINMTVFIFAGSETTATALAGTTRYLVQNRGALHRLSREVCSAFGEESDINIASTGNLEYLNAVINEGLRLCPPNVIGVPRIVPPGGDTVCGQWVPGGTYVAFNQFPAYRQSSNFRNPNSFIPERFIHQDRKADNMTAFQPFAIGRHSCVGMNLAFAEMRVTLARLLHTFDIKLADEKDTWDWGKQDSYLFWDKRPLKVQLRRRAAR